MTTYIRNLPKKIYAPTDLLEMALQFRMVIVLWLCLSRSRAIAWRGSGTPIVSDEIRRGGNLRIFSYLDLKSATRNFRPDSLLGEGGFGSVYKGWVDETGTAAARAGTGITVAVKQLNHEGLQGHKEWLVSSSFVVISFTQFLELQTVVRVM